MAGTTAGPEQSSPVLSSSLQRKRTVKFDRSIRQDPSSTIFLTKEEIQSMCWSRSETKQMKRRNGSGWFLSSSQMSDAIKRIWLVQGSSPAYVFFENIRVILERSSLDEPDFPLLCELLSMNNQTGDTSYDLSVLNDKLPKKMHNVRRVVHVQHFLHHQKEEHAKKAELLRLTSTYHSESFAEIARLIGRVDALAACDTIVM